MTQELYEQKKMDLQHTIYGTRQEPVISIEEIAKIIADRFDEAEMESLIIELIDILYGANK